MDRWQQRNEVWTCRQVHARKRHLTTGKVFVSSVVCGLWVSVIAKHSHLDAVCSLLILFTLSFQAKINNNGQIGLSCQQKVRDGKYKIDSVLLRKNKMNKTNRVLGSLSGEVENYFFLSRHKFDIVCSRGRKEFQPRRT